MKIIGSWFLLELEQLKTPGLRYDVTPDSRGRRNRIADQRYAFADLRSIAIFSTTKHPDAAARFVAYLTSPAADRLLIEEASQLPYRRGLASDPTIRDGAAAVADAVRPTPRTSSARATSISIRTSSRSSTSLSEAYEAAGIYGVVPVRQALTGAADEARKIVRCALKRAPDGC